MLLKCITKLENFLKRLTSTLGASHDHDINSELNFGACIYHPFQFPFIFKKLLFRNLRRFVIFSKERLQSMGMTKVELKHWKYFDRISISGTKTSKALSTAKSKLTRYYMQLGRILGAKKSKQFK